NLADFRRASEDFKRTWDREVSLEDSGAAAANANGVESSEPHSILGGGTAGEATSEGVQSLQAPTIAVIAADRVIARHATGSATIPSPDETGTASDQSDFENLTDGTKHSPKSDWL
ncbi:MAG TPA: hypothetical protein VGO73_07530, partial [Pyrinomonadaceae bacterium]|nr:hypothetical protein [Pyrinomonadaceae bacterium]